MLIGLTGKKHSGKDTVCNAILDHIESLGLTRGRRMAFADKLKESAAAAFNIDVPTLERHKDIGLITMCLDSGASVRLSLRQFLQRYGTEAHRDIFGEDFWVAYLDQEMQMMPRVNELTVITDVRFPNEAAMIHGRGGKVVRVERIPDPDPDLLDPHPSEEVVPADYTLLNPVDNPAQFEQNVIRMLLWAAAWNGYRI